MLSATLATGVAGGEPDTNRGVIAAIEATLEVGVLQAGDPDGSDITVGVNVVGGYGLVGVNVVGGCLPTGMNRTDRGAGGKTIPIVGRYPAPVGRLRGLQNSVPVVAR